MIAMMEYIKSKTNSVMESISAKTTATTDSISSKITAVMRSISAKTTATTDSISSKMTAVMQSISAKTAATTDSISSKITAVMENIGLKMNDFGENISLKTSSVMEMITAETVAMFIMLPCIWSLFQIIVLGNFSYLIYMIPYAVTFQSIDKNSTRKKTRGTNAGFQDFTLANKKDASTSTDDIDFANKTSIDKIEENVDNGQNDILDSNPFLKIMDNIVAHGDPFNPFNLEIKYNPYQLKNPFMVINPLDNEVNCGEPYPPLQQSNPFLQDCVNNPFSDTMFQILPVLEDEYLDLPFAPRESDVYCKEWVEQHRKCYINSVRSFSCC